MSVSELQPFSTQPGRTAQVYTTGIVNNMRACD